MSQSLPEDVLRLIVEVFIEDLVRGDLGASRELPATVMTCKHFKDWSYPVFYRTVRLESPARLKLLTETVTNCQRLASFVRNLVLPSEAVIDHEIVNTVNACVGLQRLLCWHGISSAAVACDISKHTSLVRISCDPHLLGLTPGKPVLPAHPLMRSTHLDLCAFDNINIWYPTIACLSNLTHLFLLIHRFSSREVGPLLPLLPPNLRVCILFSTNDEPPNPAYFEGLGRGEVDPRVVIGLADMYPNPNPPTRRPHFLHIYREDMADLKFEWVTENTKRDFREEAEFIIETRSRRGQGYLLARPDGIVQHASAEL